MALTSEQKSSRLFKKAFGLAETITARDFFEESYVGPSLVMPSQIWTEADKIPPTAPSLSDGEISGGIIQYYEKLELTHIPGSQDRSYSDERLKNALDFTIDATYNYKLFENDGTTPIPDGLGDWLVDREAGVLSFYGTLPSISAAAPPMVSFYRYVGETGLQISGATSGINVKDPVVAATIEELSGVTYSDTISGFTSLPIDIDGVTTFTEGYRFLVKNQTDDIQNGIFQVSGTTLVRAADHDGNPFGEVGVNDYTFVVSGATLIATSWVLGSTDASDVNHIEPGIDTQNWKLFSESKAYEASETGIKLQNGNTFYLDLDEGGTHGSGLEQSVDGVRIKSSILSDISTNASDISTNTGNISSNSSAISSLSSDVNTNTGNISSNSSAISSLSSDVNTNTGNISSNSSAISSLSSDVNTNTGNISSNSSAISSLSSDVNTNTGNISSNSSAISSLSSDVNTNSSAISSLSSDVNTNTGNISSNSSAISSLSSDVNTNTGNISSNSSAISSLSSDVNTNSTAIAANASLISSNSSEISSLSASVSANASGVSSNSSAISSLSTSVSSNTSGVSTNSSAISSLSSTVDSNTSAISTNTSDISTNSAAISTLSTQLGGLDGDGLSYTGETLNVNVDDFTIKVVNDELRGQQIWIQNSSTVSISGGTSGYTGISLDYEPVTPVLAYVNGIEYLVSPSTTSQTNFPFYYSAYPPTVGTEVGFDTTIAGFDLESGVDLVTIKFNYIDIVP